MYSLSPGPESAAERYLEDDRQLQKGYRHAQAKRLCMGPVICNADRAPAEATIFASEENKYKPQARSLCSFTFLSSL